MDGHAGFRTGQTYQLTPDTWDDGTVTVEMPHAPAAGRAALGKPWCPSCARRLGVE